MFSAFLVRPAAVDRPVEITTGLLVMAAAADEIPPRQQRPCESPRRVAGECGRRGCLPSARCCE
jgi:hypothetical protein